MWPERSKDQNLMLGSVLTASLDLWHLLHDMSRERAAYGCGEAGSAVLVVGGVAGRQAIGGAATYIVTRPRHVAVNELLIRSTEQAC